jgi:hypothetical protein
MEKIGKQKKSRTDRLTQLAQTLVCCAGPDVYFAQNERLQQVNLPPPELTDYMYIVPEQIFTLARVENYSVLTHHSRS